MSVVEVGHRHLVEGPVPDDGGVGDDRIEPTPRVHGLLGQAGGAGDVGDRRRVGDGLAALGPDLLDDGLGQTGVLAAAERVAAEVVHHHPRSTPGELQRVAPAHATTRTGHDHDVTVEAQRAHRLIPSSGQPTMALSAIVG